MTIRTNQSNGHFPSLEDSVLELERNGSLAKVSTAAIRKQKARGVPVVFKCGNNIVKQFPNGRVTILKRLPKSAWPGVGGK